MITNADNWFLLHYAYHEDDGENEYVEVGIDRVAAWCVEEVDGESTGLALTALQTEHGAMLVDAYEHYDYTVIVHGDDYTLTHPTGKWREMYFALRSPDDVIRAPAIDAIKKALELDGDQDVRIVR